MNSEYQYLEILSSKVCNMIPEVAAKILQENVGNRKLRQPLAFKYRKLMDDGQWRLTHQGIALDECGHLLDGQHRLKGICDHGKPVPILVTTYAGHVDPLMNPFDVGRLRSSSDITGLPPWIVQTIRGMTEGLYSSPRQLDATIIRMAYEELIPELNALSEAVLVKTKIYNSAGVKAAMLVMAMENQLRAVQFMLSIQKGQGGSSVKNLRNWLEENTSFTGWSGGRARFARTWVAAHGSNVLQDKVDDDKIDSAIIEMRKIVSMRMPWLRGNTTAGVA